MTCIEQNLQALGLLLPDPPKPIASYLPSMVSGNLLFVSGQLPLANGRLLATGAVPETTDLPTAQKAARQCVLNGLAIVHHTLEGQWDRLAKAVRVGVFVLSNNGFADQAQVANGASDLLVELMGDAGRHARAAVGVNALPLNASVEIEFCFEIKP